MAAVVESGWVETQDDVWRAATKNAMLADGYVETSVGKFLPICWTPSSPDIANVIAQIKAGGPERTVALGSLRWMVSQVNEKNRRALAIGGNSYVPAVMAVLDTSATELDLRAACWIFRHGGRGNTEIIQHFVDNGALKILAKVIRESRSKHKQLHAIACDMATGITFHKGVRNTALECGVALELVKNININENIEKSLIAMSNINTKNGVSPTLAMEQGLDHFTDVQGVPRGQGIGLAATIARILHMEPTDGVRLSVWKFLSNAVQIMGPYLGHILEQAEVMQVLLKDVETTTEKTPPESCGSWAVTFVQRIALLDMARGVLPRLGFIQPLARMMKTSSYQGMKAAIAVTTLIGRDESSGNEINITPSVLTVLLDCFGHVIRGTSGNGFAAGLFELIELATCFRNLCVSDTNKLLLLEKADQVLDCFCDVLTQEVSKNSDSVECTIEALLQLSCDDNFKKQIAAHRVVNVVKNLNGTKASELCWSLQDKTSARRASVIDKEAAKSQAEVATPGVPATSAKVFISYSWAQADKVRAIAQTLKQMDYDVWLDVDQMTGDTLERMADGIDAADVVLCGISTQYKESTNCRLEGQYAQCQRKLIIPLMLEENYRPKGWLGILMGPKLWYDFTFDLGNKSKFQESITGVVKDIAKQTGTVASTRTVAAATEPPATAAPSDQIGKQVCAWSCEETQTWLKDRGVASLVKPFAHLQLDGVCLMEMWLDPTAFELVCSSIGSVSLRDRLHLKSALRALHIK